MEIRQNVARVPTRPIAVVIAFLALVALAVTGWAVLRTNSTSPTSPFEASPACAALGRLAVDPTTRFTALRASAALAYHGKPALPPLRMLAPNFAARTSARDSSDARVVADGGGPPLTP